MSFNVIARKIRDADLPFARRVSTLRSAVELYRPIGFDNTLSFLEEIAGRYRDDEAALLRAIDALAASRATWQIAVGAYGHARRLAKRRGERSPRPGEVNPNHPDRWYGDTRRAALHVMRKERAELERLARAAGPGSVEAQLGDLVNIFVTAGGELSPDQCSRLSAVAMSLDARLTPELWRADYAGYICARKLRHLAKLMMASDGG